MDISTIPWVALVLVAAVLGTMSAFIDNYTADVLFDGRHAQAEKMIFGPLYLIMGIVLLCIFRPSFGAILPIVLLFGAGMLSSLGSIPYFAGLEREETTTAKIFAQLIPIFSLVLAWIFLHQAITGQQLAAFGVILLAPLIVILAKRRRSKKVGMKAAGFFVLYGLINAASALLFVSGVNMVPEQSFWACLAVLVCGKGSGDMLIMAAKRNWRKQFYRRVKVMKWKMFLVVGANFAVWQCADLLYRFSTVSSDSVALVSATYEAVELIATFFFGVVLSLLWPNFGREKLDKRTVMAHLAATVVALIGILMIK